MSRQLLFVLVFCSLLTMLTAEDTIPGGNVSGTWYAANSPYYIAGNIAVPSGDTLTIEPGVDVIFLGYYRLNVNGQLVADGTASDSIRFVPQDTTVGWRGLYYALMSTQQLSYCDIKYARESGIWLQAVLISLRVSHCTITHCRSDYGGGIRVQGLHDTLNISHSTIAYNTAETDAGGKGGGIYLFYGKLTMDSCTVHANRAVIPTEDYYHTVRGGGIYIGAATFDVTISNSSITDNFIGLSNGGKSIGIYPPDRGGGIYNGSEGPVTIFNCLISGNQANVDWRGGGGIASDVNANMITLSNCEISHNWTYVNAGGFETSSDANIINCTFSGNYYFTIMCFVDAGGRTCNVLNSVVAYNNSGIYFAGGSTCTLTIWHCDIIDDCQNTPAGFGVLDTVNYNGDSCDCFFNIFMDPQFVDTANGDLHLLAGSPCIDAGDPTYPYDPDSTIADQGCYFFDQRMPSIALSTIALDFGGVSVGQSADLPFIIYNLGEGILRISDISNNLAVFVHNWSPLDSIVPPGDSLEVMVTFTPDDTTTFNDTCWIDNNDTLCCVTLTGQGLPTGVTEGASVVPKAFALRQPLPNPCKAYTRIHFELPEASVVSLSVYDVNGRLVSQLINGLYEVGIHEAILDASALSAGVYFYRLKSAGYSAIRKIIVTK